MMITYLINYSYCYQHKTTKYFLKASPMKAALNQGF